MAGLNDPDRFPFPPDQKAALRFADAMTEGDGHVEDALFEELKRHFDEAQVVEIASVIGVFNYFNRFNNAFRMDITLADPDLLVHAVEAAAAEERDPRALCARTSDILTRGRRYLWLAVYRREKDLMVGVGSSGPTSPGGSFRLGEGSVGTVGKTGQTLFVDMAPLDATRSELVLPVRSGTAVVGAMAVGSDRESGFDEEDRALLERVAEVLSPALAVGTTASR